MIGDAPSAQSLDPESGLPPDVAGTIVTVGTFDGVHLGHQDVLRRLVARAKAAGRRSVLVTFEPHPLEVVSPSAAPQLLTPGRERLEAVAPVGIDYLAVIAFTREFASLEAAEFVDLVLLRRMRMRELLIGHDHGFGRGRAGDVEFLRTLGAQRGFGVEVVPPVSVGDGRPISSTEIRRAVAGGDLRRAEQGLGRLYSASGRVGQGDQRGRLLGFPTVNVQLPSPRKLLPPEGVYAVRVQTPRGEFGGMLNLGPRPTFDDQRTSMEAHLFDAAGDFYGAYVRVDFVARLRDTRRFASAAELIDQLGRDSEQARAALAKAPAHGQRSAL
jgi:riboflavin kinase/FMN adenylyltransferase